MVFAVFAFLAVFLLIASGGLLLFYREAMLQRISEVINPRRKQKSADSRRSSRPGLRSATWWSASRT